MGKYPKNSLPMAKPKTTKGVPEPLFHDDDWNMLLVLKRTLAGHTVTAGVPYWELAARVGVPPTFLGRVLQGNFNHNLSRLQQWALMFDLRLDCMLEGVTYVLSEDMVAMEAWAARREKHKFQRLLLNEQLIAAREAQGMSHRELGSRCGILAKAASDSEQRMDWMLPHLFRRVRALGGTLTFELAE